MIDKWHRKIIDKLNLAFIGLLGPDFLFAIAAGQLSSAMRAREVCLVFTLKSSAE